MPLLFLQRVIFLFFVRTAELNGQDMQPPCPPGPQSVVCLNPSSQHFFHQRHGLGNKLLVRFPLHLGSPWPVPTYTWIHTLYIHTPTVCMHMAWPLPYTCMARGIKDKRIRRRLPPRLAENIKCTLGWSRPIRHVQQTKPDPMALRGLPSIELQDWNLMGWDLDLGRWNYVELPGDPGRGRYRYGWLVLRWFVAAFGTWYQCLVFLLDSFPFSFSAPRVGEFTVDTCSYLHHLTPPPPKGGPEGMFFRWF